MTPEISRLPEFVSFSVALTAGSLAGRSRGAALKGSVWPAVPSSCRRGTLVPAPEMPAGLRTERRALGTQTRAKEAQLVKGARRAHAAPHGVWGAGGDWSVSEEGAPGAQRRRTHCCLTEFPLLNFRFTFQKVPRALRPEHASWVGTLPCVASLGPSTSESRGLGPLGCASGAPPISPGPSCL